MSPHPSFSGNDFTYFSERHKAIETTKPLWYKRVDDYKLHVRSNSLLYWPRAEIIFKSTDRGTVVTVKYIGTVLAYILYGVFVGSFIALIFFTLLKAPSDFASPLLAFIVFIILLASIPLLLRKIQNNMLTMIEYS